MAVIFVIGVASAGGNSAMVAAKMDDTRSLILFYEAFVSG
jgi:hypothetical protein